MTSINKNSEGQVMLITVILLSGAILASTSLIGLLTRYQLRQASDINASMKAIFAADAGIEWAFYNENKLIETGLYKDLATPQTVSLTNGAKFTVSKVPSDPSLIKSIGQFGLSARAFEGGVAPAAP